MPSGPGALLGADVWIALANLICSYCWPVQYRSRCDWSGWGCFWWLGEHSLPEGVAFGLEVYSLLSLEVEDWRSLYSSRFGVFVGRKNVLSLG